MKSDDGPAATDSDIVHMRRRIHDLEQLIRSLVENRNIQDVAARDQQENRRADPALSTSPTAASQRLQDAHDHDAAAGNEVSESIGRIKIGNAETIYVSPNHWAAILDNVVHPSRPS